MKTATTTTEWPAGVIARALTLGGATADVIDDVTDNRPSYQSDTHTVRGACTGESCDETHRPSRFTFSAGDDPKKDEDFQRVVARVQSWARGHAETCRWLPRPA